MIFQHMLAASPTCLLWLMFSFLEQDMPLCVQPFAGSCHACCFKQRTVSVAHVCLPFFWPCLLFWHGFQAWLQAHVFSFKCFASNSFFWLMLFGHVLFADVGLVQSKSAGRARLNVDTYCAWHCFVASKLSGTPTSHFSHSSCCM